MTKAELRFALRKRYELSDGAADKYIAKRLFFHPLYREASRIFLYVGVGDEVNTMPIIENAVEHGKTVVLPKSYGNGRMEFFRYSGKLVPGMYGIPEPVSEDVLVPVAGDIMIVPGLAFDKLGNRLGQGGGYYDRYLADYPCHCIGLCRSEFFLEEIPVEWNDLPVNCVITENETAILRENM